MHVVAAVIDQGALTFDMAIPCEVFGLDRSDIVDPWYEFLLVAGARRVRTQTGFTVDVSHGLEELDRADTIVVPGWSNPDDDPSEKGRRRFLPRTLRATRLAHRRSFSQQPGFDDRRATTHWMYVERLRQRHPRVRIDPDVLYVADDNVMTSAGTTAGIDLCLHLVALDHGLDVAAAVARRLVMPLYRSGGQAQYVDTPIAEDPRGLSALLDWGRANLGVGITVDDLAERGAMSTRTLTRRFRSAIGIPPGEWLKRERLRLAQRLLERTDDPLELVARRAGYDAAVTMRAQFAARLDTSPRAYRRLFRGDAGLTR
jgi:transcriptional regulator GlxA family with amidase domain